jgi:HEPN domain-containing protein
LWLSQIIMTKEEKIKYWLKASDYDWMVANHLYEKKDYPYALFFGHLTIEKLLKGLYIKEYNKTPPYSHRLVSLLEKLNLDVNEKNLQYFEIITDFNLEARYPDEKFQFYNKCTKEFTKKYMDIIKELKTWLTQLIAL